MGNRGQTRRDLTTEPDRARRASGDPTGSDTAGCSLFFRRLV